MLAARNGNPDALKVLIEAGADVIALERLRGTTALMSLFADFRARSKAQYGQSYV